MNCRCVFQLTVTSMMSLSSVFCGGDQVMMPSCTGAAVVYIYTVTFLIHANDNH